ncbi:MAG: transketolase [Micromonosporaceae bacterium]
MAEILSWVPASEFGRVLAGIVDRRDRCAAFATLSRINTLYMIMRAGSGHIGSSFSAADIVTWLLLAELRAPFTPDGDVYFSSKGHDAPGLYAALIGLGRLDDDLVHRLRRLDGLPGHPDVGTPHTMFNTGSLGMGISKAKGAILADRLLGRARRFFVLTGDGELQEGQNWEALAGAVHHGMGELTVIVDHNKLQSDTWVRDVSDLGDIEAKFGAFGWGVLRCDGHDFDQLESALRERGQRLAGKPAVLVADTVKGAGCATFAATSMPDGQRQYRFHSGAPAIEDYRGAHGELCQAANELLRRHGLPALALRSADPPATTPSRAPRLTEVYGRELSQRAGGDPRIVALDADLLVDTGLLPFAQRHPRRLFECGIAEQDMVSMAGGMAAAGLLPFVHSFSCFLHSRSNEHMYNNATERRRIVYVGSLAGLLPATPGHSHQAVRDVSAVGGIPGLTVLEPAGPAEVVAALDYCLATPDSVYLRLASTPCPPEVAGLPAVPLVAGRGHVLRPGDPVVAIGAGPVVLTQLLRAADRLASAGVRLTVVDLPWLNRVDPDWLCQLATGCTALFVVENHYTHGGQADLVARALLELGLAAPPRFHGIGLTGIPRCGADLEVLAAHGLDAASLASTLLAHVPATAVAATGGPGVPDPRRN